MTRSQFLKFTIGGLAMTTFSSFKKLTDDLQKQDFLMPVLFIGHGSPMNGIEDNEFSQRWTKIATEIPVPKAVLVVSAHWFTRGTKITAMDFPKTIHDFGGFPQELFKVQYNAPGSPALAAETKTLIHSTEVELDHDWGLDHGTWTIIRHMYPDANIPVLQLSIDFTKGPKYHYELAQELTELRKKGVLIIGSGNMVHNLRMISWDMMNGGGYDWTNNLNEKFKALIKDKNHEPLINYTQLGREASLAIPTPEHYLPLLYSLGLQQKRDEVNFFNDKAVGGSLTMTSVRIG
jgi:4,5-DOPA dioxygenase extradiol